jgi:hypothetical protein
MEGDKKGFGVGARTLLRFAAQRLSGSAVLSGGFRDPNQNITFNGKLTRAPQSPYPAPEYRLVQENICGGGQCPSLWSLDIFHQGDPRLCALP